MVFEVEPEATDWKTSSDKQALVRYANVLGVKMDGRAGIETIRKEIALKLGDTLDSNGVELEEPEQTESAPSFLGYANMRKEITREKKYVIIMQSTDRDPFPAEGGVNGVPFVVPRDVECILPESMIAIFRKAVEDRYRWDAVQMKNIPMKVPMYPISIIREATAEDLANEKLNAQKKATKKVVG